MTTNEKIEYAIARKEGALLFAQANEEAEGWEKDIKELIEQTQNPQ